MPSLFSSKQLAEWSRAIGKVQPVFKHLYIEYRRVITMAIGTTAHGQVKCYLNIDVTVADGRTVMSEPLAEYDFGHQVLCTNDAELLSRLTGLSIRRANPTGGWLITDPVPAIIAMATDNGV